MNIKKKLKSQVKTKVRFSEVDSMGVVWHGNYVKYLEDGRENFGNEFGLGYLDVFGLELMTPIVKLDIDYKSVIKYGEEIVIETEYIQSKAAKIIFKYKIYNANTKKLAITAKTIQVFIDMEGQLQITNPNFYEEWKKEHGIFED